MGTKMKSSPIARLSGVAPTSAWVDPETPTGELKKCWIRKDENGLILEGIKIDPHNESYEEVAVDKIPTDISNGYYTYGNNTFTIDQTAYTAFQERVKPDTSVQDLLLQLGEAQTVIFENQLLIMEQLNNK